MECSERQQPCVGSVLPVEAFDKVENQEQSTQNQEPDSGEEYDSDLERKCGMESIHSNSAVAQYLRACQRSKTLPVTSFLSHIGEADLNFNFYGLGPSGFKALATVLQSDSNLVNLELEENALQAEGAGYLTTMLRKNTNIQSLNVSNNQLCHQGAEIISEMLLDNNNVKSIKLSGNDLDDCAAKCIARALEGDFVVKELDLSHNMICDNEGDLLGFMLAKIVGLEILNLSGNSICTRGALALSDKLKVNSTLKELQLSWNGFGQSEAEALGLALVRNSTLQLLDLSNNRLDDQAVTLLCQGLAANKALSILKLSHNPVTGTGALTLLRTVKNNTASAMEYIDISTVLVSETFMQLLEEARQSNPALQVHCRELTSVTRNLSALQRFQESLQERNETISDFFRALDKEGTMTVSTSVFRKAVQAAKIPLDQRQLNWLIRDLDRSCTAVINYSRFA